MIQRTVYIHRVLLVLATQHVIQKFIKNVNFEFVFKFQKILKKSFFTKIVVVY